MSMHFNFIFLASADPGSNENGLGRMILLRHPKSGNRRNIHYLYVLVITLLSRTAHTNT